MPSVRSQTSYYLDGHYWFKKHKETVRKKEGDVVNSTSLLPLLILKITKRFYNSTTFETLLRPSIIIDLHTCVEADLVDRAFTKQYALKTAPFFAPKL